MEVSARSVRAKNLRRVAGQILSQMYLASRLHQMFSDAHENVRQAYDLLSSKLDELFSFEERFRLTVEDGYLFANDIRLRVERTAAEAYDWHLSRMADSGIASVVIKREVKPVELRKFVPIFAKANWPEGGDRPEVARDLLEQFVMNITVGMRTTREIVEDDGGKVEVSARELAVALWVKLHAAATELVEATRTGQRLALRRARYLIQLAVDTMLEDEASLIAMTRSKNYVPEGLSVASPHAAYLESHIANTCILALGLGNKIGLARRQLLDLGTAALTVDLGMIFVPREIREKPGPLTSQERAVMVRHPMHSAEALLRSDEASAVNRLCAIVATDHHPRGYPRLREGAKVSLLAMIVAIADAYDAMTTDRPWRRAHAHGEALRAIVAGEGSHDRLLSKTFANMLGVYPAGSIVELSGGEIGVIVEQHEEAGLAARPRVKLLMDAQGRNVEGQVIDTAEKLPAGLFRYTIDRVIDLRDLAAGPNDLVALL
jgi:HD-GYP domain-containing protein (c-di-GMP phosphodiesterase class II)